MTKMTKEPEATILMETQKNKDTILTALTLVMYQSLGCDILPATSIDGKEYFLNPNTLNLFKGFLDSICQKVNIADVIEEIVEVKTNKKDA